jgi:hypothetical protein
MESNAGVTAALEWTLMYGQSVTHAARQSARTAPLFHRVIEQVSRGTVSAASLHALLDESGRIRGARVESSISGLHEGFVRGLADISLERAQKTSPADLPPASEFCAHVTRLCFALLNDLTDVRTKYQEDYLREALALGAVEGAQAVTLIAEPGAVASATLSVSSATTVPATVRCVAGGVRRVDGIGPAFVPVILMTPDIVEVQPGEERTVTFSISLDDSVYQPEATYVGELHLEHATEPCVILPLTITATRAGRR